MMRYRTLLLTLLACLLLTPAYASSVSPAAFQALAKAQELVQKSEWQQAHSALDAILSAHAKEPYALATALQLKGYILNETGKHAEALQAFEQVLALGALESSAEQQILYNVAQLLASVGRQKEAAARITTWLAHYPTPTPAQQIQAAWIFLGAQQFAAAATQIEAALRSVEGRPEESWYQMLILALQGTENHASLKQWLPLVIEHYPNNKNYWMQLTSTYLNTQERQKAVAAISTAYHNGLLREESDIRYAVQLYLHAGVPHKAARVLSDALERGIVLSDAKHYEQLADIWFHAREMGTATQAFHKALEHGAGHETSLKLGRMLVQQQEWHAAREHLQRAARSEHERTKSEALILLGMAAYSEGNMAEARDAFGQARRFGKVRRQAEGWLKYLQQEG
ncbi:tetratricopeptide repeat protein [Chrysiogenes arsenatis]|uniref:tetratricopeptide repeat protein n=1 Tax=Chrysiogenes arsenatis TaxID=309797 RepID=UPI0003FC52A8|nr:tetratricopeptide repeat protein [Chrysiogenes arsenatis]